MKRLWKKIISGATIVCMMTTIIPNLFIQEVSATTADYQDVNMQGAKIVNYGDMQTLDSNFNKIDSDAFSSFIRSRAKDQPEGTTKEGITWVAQDDYPYPDGIEEVDGHFWGVINVAANPTLKRLAEGGSAKFLVHVDKLNCTDDNGAYIWAYTDSQFRKEEEGGDGYKYSISKWKAGASSEVEDLYDTNSGWLSFGPNDYIIIETETHDAGTQVEGISLYFADIERPTISNYTFTSTGTERLNSTINQKELFLKKNENLNLKYEFSEPIKATYPTTTLNEHALFTNPAGTGLPGAGQNQKMTLENSLADFTNEISYKYTAAEYHHTGNLPIDNGGELYPGATPLNEESLITKMDEANFCDGAGNPLQVSNNPVASNESKDTIKGKNVNPFDFEGGGYRVIIDAVPPKYTMVGNGIQPEILTGLTLNKGDVIDFTVQLTEDVIVRDGYDPSKLFLYFNNGMKAYYVDGSNDKNWKFSATISGEENLNVPLLKCIALTHDEKGDNSDKDVIQDYAGNMLVDSANTEKGEAVTDPSQAIPMTKITWAKLSIDNTNPIIGFNYNISGANDKIYKKNAKVTIDANDPQITVPELDPDEPGAVRPSKGIYRPGNMTGATEATSPAVGLVYYFWSKDSEDPFVGKEADNFAAIKRYSLTGEQPSAEIYPGEFQDFNLMVANNKTNMLAPPNEALEPENSGIWYLHTWTADMTWDSARELMQYEKMKNFKATNVSTFEDWINEYKVAHVGASEADAISYAEKKALEAVGNYKDTSMWNVSDFKKADSNWTYNKAEIKLDNAKPTITIGSISGNDSYVVTVPVELADNNSGLDNSNLKYQWVKTGKAISEINWENIPNDRVITTLNNVIEDGEYDLYVKATDIAGNEDMKKISGVKVNSAVKVGTSFMPNTNENYTKSTDVTFSIRGLIPEKTEYAFSSSSVRPNDSLYKDITASAKDNENGGKDYLVPATNTLNGICYAHIKVKVKEQEKDRYYYYYKDYKFDNTVPEITFSKNGVSYPSETHSVTITASDKLSSVGMVKKYQWIKSGDSIPDETSTKWTVFPENNTAVINNEALKVGETVDYILCTYVTDAAGNSAIKNTDIFKVTKKSEVDTPIAAIPPDLLYIYGDVTDGFYAVIKLGLEVVLKEGFGYSISSDNGDSWTRWKPYTNFVEVNVPINNINSVGDIKIKVKYKSPKGKISEAIELNTKLVSKIEPVYGIASHSILKPTQNMKLDIKVQAGIKVVPSVANPMIPVKIGNSNKYEVTQNGCYSFDLTDVTDISRKNTLLVVVDNIDTTSPEGSIEYSITENTNSNVTVKLDTAEAVRIINNDGLANYTFTENGIFEFKFEDEAGNEGLATATVSNIDRTPPTAKIIKLYTYGTNGSKTFNSIKDEANNVLVTEGVTLEVQKINTSDKDFKVLGGNNKLTLQKNGVVNFSIIDDSGNTLVLSEDIQNIVSYLPEPTEVIYTFVDEDGNPVPEADIKTINNKKYAKGKMKVTINGKNAVPNKVFSGTVPAKDQLSEAYLNLISDETGNYSYSKIYSANGETSIAICDLLGNVNKVSIKVEGIDNEAPSIVLNAPKTSVEKNKQNFNPMVDLKGYTVSDNVSKSENIVVTISNIDLSKTGKQNITYTAKDEAGNVSQVIQSVYVIPGDGMLILGNDTLISAASSETVLFDRSDVTFNISRHNLIDVEGKSMINELGKYDILYKSGLYREGQMKYIAQKISLKQLLANEFKVEFPEVGWYTIIIRNQERQLEYSTFFIGKMSKK